jgi:N-dimethylarginine dimethylaminohydrolase
MGYNLIKPVTTFEGEADLKWLRDNIYVGGYGIRTDIRTHYWLEDVTGAEITKIEMNDGGLYHFDCMFLPLTHEKALVATQAIKPDDLRKLEKLVEIIPVPVSYLYFAWTNCLVFGKEVLYGPATPELGNAFGDYISKYGYEPIIVELTEFEKSGAALSCACMHLNYKARLNK